MRGCELLSQWATAVNAAAVAAETPKRHDSHADLVPVAVVVVAVVVAVALWQHLQRVQPLGLVIATTA